MALMELSSYSSSYGSEVASIYSDIRSCKFSSNASTCIQKAKVNLSLLQNHLNEWQNGLNMYNKILQEQQEKLKFNESEKHKLVAIESGALLEVFGTEIANKPLPVPQKEEDHQINKEKYTKSANVHKQLVANTYNLLERLESDRSSMVDLLEKEQKRTATLREKIDWHAYKRINDLPCAVQKEHEKCAYDVEELKWHCAYRGRAETRIEEKVRLAESTNKNILEEMDFVQEHSPLIQDKLKLENDSMIIIQEKQTNTNKELKDAKEQLKNIELEFEQTKRHADVEQKMLAGRILSLSNEFNTTLENFLSSQRERERMSQTILTAQEQITADDEETTHLDKKMLKVGEIVKHLEGKVEEITEEIFAQTAEFQKLTEENKQSEEKAVLQATENNNSKKSFEKLIRTKTVALQKLMKTNKNMSKEISNIKKRIENCEKQKKSDSKSVKRSRIEGEKIMGDLKIIREETDQMRSKHEKLLLKLGQERIKSSEIEENLTFTSDTLKKQNKEESHARMILQARINAAAADFAKKKEESEKKRDKLVKMETDLSRVLSTVNEQVEKLSKRYEERLKGIEAVNKLLGQVAAKHKDLDESLALEINTLEPIQEELKVKLAETCQKQEDVYETSKGFDKKLRDMASSSIMMNKLLLSNQNTIDELKDELEELQIQLDSGQGLEKTLRESLEQVQERSNEQVVQHELQMKNRENASNEMKERLVQSLLVNKELAIKYIDLQNQHISEKNKFVNTYEKAMVAEDSLNDKKTLCELHSRLHDALKCYYQLRGIQTKAGLSRFEAMTESSNKKLGNIQRELETTTRNISTFLAANNKSHKLLQLQNAAVRNQMKV